MFSATWNIYTVYIWIDLDCLNLYNNIKQATAKDFKTSPSSDLMWGSRAYRVDPVNVGADFGEDSGLLGEVAAEPGAKADNAMNLPGTTSVLTVQRSTRVALIHVTENIWSVFKFHMQQAITSCPLKTLWVRLVLTYRHFSEILNFMSNIGVAIWCVILCHFYYFRLTLQPDTTPSPPAQTMVSFTWKPHQSGLVQVAWSTTGRRACCRMSAMGPPAVWRRDE